MSRIEKFLCVLFVLYCVCLAPRAHAETEPEILVGAYFFAVETGNYEGAYKQYSPEMQAYFGNEKKWEKRVLENVPMLFYHDSKEVREIARHDDKAVV